MLKDYTTGSLVHVNLRPDYDTNKHGEVIQSGFNDIVEEPTGEDVPLSEASTVGGMTAPITKPKLVTNETESALDKEFFAKKQKKTKLNKGEKRALKFML